MNAPAVVAVVLVAIVLVVLGFVVTVVVAQSLPSQRYTSDDALAGTWREVGT